MGIYFFAEDVDMPKIDFQAVQKVLKREIRINKCKLGLINYIFCSDPYLLDINIKFLKHDYFTDVITFDYTDGLVVSGDIYISTDMVMNNSVIFSQIFQEELMRVISHGLLHLLKFNDKEEEEVIAMRRKESDMLNSFKGYSKIL